MKIEFLLLCLTITLTSCSLQDAVNNNFEHQSSVEEFARAKTLADAYGNGQEIIFKTKIPLTEDSIGYFDVDEILGNSELNSQRRSLIQRLYDNLKLAGFNLFVGLGISNKIKYSSNLDFPRIDPELIISAKVIKVFFTTEDCRREEAICNDRKRFSSNFDFLDEFFLNIKATEEKHKDNSSEQIVTLSNSEFKQASDESFSQKHSDVQKILSNGHSNHSKGKSINLVKFKNDDPLVDLEEYSISENLRVITFRMKNRKQHHKFERFLKEAHLREVIHSVKSENDTVRVKLRKESQPEILINSLKLLQPSSYQKMMIFRLNGQGRQAKEYFESESYKNIIKEATMIGRSLFVELKNSHSYSELMKQMHIDKNYLNEELSIQKVERCLKTNCLELNVKDVNLVPLLTQNTGLTLETFLSVKTLGNSDFKYNGYVEVEIKWRSDF